MTIKTTIPTDWERTRLGLLFDFKNGVNAEKSSYGEGVKFINVMEIIKNHTLTHNVIPGKIMLDENQIEKNLVIYGDVLFNRTSETPEEIGLTSVYLDTEKVVFGGFVIRARSKNKRLNNRYKKYCFLAPSLRKEIVRNGQGVVRMNIGQEDLSQIPLLLPTLSEQEKIVEVLETWDSYLEKLSDAINLKRKVKKGQMRKLLTGKLRVNGFNQDWRVIKLGEVCQRLKRKNAENNRNVLTISAQYGLVSQEEFFNKKIASDNLDKYTLLLHGDFAYNKSYSKGYPMGAIKMLKKYSKGVVSSLYITFVPRKINPVFLDYYFACGLFNQEIAKTAQEGARNHGLLNIGIDDFLGGDLRIPIDEEQTAIAQILTTADQEIEALEKKKELIEQQRKFLLNNMITGKLRLPEFIKNKPSDHFADVSKMVKNPKL